jgi:hypothetical protein
MLRPSLGGCSPGEIDARGIEEAIELCAQPLAPYSTLDDSDEEDPILAEAMNIAREMISARFAELELPLPKGLDAHAKALVDGAPAILEQARLRVEAKYNAMASILMNGGDII